MPSIFHENMAGKVGDKIIKWLGAIETGLLGTVDSTKKRTEEVASSISSSLAARVKCDEPRDDQLEPDLSYTHDDSSTAGLVVEVAWSQSNLKLPFRATRYIVEGTNGKIRTVVGFNMNNIYRGGNRATFSIWKAQLVDNKWSRIATVEGQVRFWEDYVLLIL